MLRGFAILLGFELSGELLVRAVGLRIPGSVLGMAFLFAALLLRVVSVEWIEGAANALLDHLGLFFVPAGVGVVVYAELVRREWLSIAVPTIVSTFAVIAATGWVAQRLGPRSAGAGGRAARRRRDA